MTTLAHMEELKAAPLSSALNRSNIITTKDIRVEHLVGLRTGEIAAVRVPDFYEKTLCQEIAVRMSQSELFGRYANAPKIARVGQAFYESQASEYHRIVYEQHAVDWISEMRARCTPYLSPIDKLRLTLDESWPEGARLATLEGKKMFVGLARVFGQNANAEAHQDILAWDAPHSAQAQDLLGQFAANIYLKMPSEGGELLVWPESLSLECYNQIKNPGSYGVDTAQVSSQPISLKPELGELILFNSTHLHAVQAPKTGERITWSCFIGDRGTQKSLMMWS